MIRQACQPHYISTPATDQTVVSGNGFLHGLIVNTDGTNNATLTIKDGAAIIAVLSVPGANRTGSVIFAAGVRFGTSLVYTLSGANSTATVLHAA